MQISFKWRLCLLENVTQTGWCWCYTPPLSFAPLTTVKVKCQFQKSALGLKRIWFLPRRDLVHVSEKTFTSYLLVFQSNMRVGELIRQVTACGLMKSSSTISTGRKSRMALNVEIYLNLTKQLTGEVNDDEFLEYFFWQTFSTDIQLYSTVLWFAPPKPRATAFSVLQQNKQHT